ncbi:MAG: DUF3301 domain-containing protein [bacterium]
MEAIIPLVVLGGITLLWLDGARAREIATGVCKAVCQRNGVQFLEGTVFMKRFAPHWGKNGIRIRRTFQFDYSADGAERRTGLITMLGMKLENVSISTVDNSVIEGEFTEDT